jgi:hypothetical protein
MEAKLVMMDGRIDGPSGGIGSVYVGQCYFLPLNVFEKTSQVSLPSPRLSDVPII